MMMNCGRIVIRGMRGEAPMLMAGRKSSSGGCRIFFGNRAVLMRMNTASELTISKKSAISSFSSFAKVGTQKQHCIIRTKRHHPMLRMRHNKEQQYRFSHSGASTDKKPSSSPSSASSAQQ
eukprot:6162260-Ditylum_brightwellii.AAC.1